MLGISAILISTKYEEIYPPEMKDLLGIAEGKYVRADLLRMETRILHCLEYDFMFPSPLRFLERYRKISSILQYDDRIFFFAQYLLEISLLDAALLKFKPSQLSAAAIILSARAVKRVTIWNKDMEQWTGYKEEDLKEVVEDVRSFAHEVNPKFLSTLKYKFGKPENHEVASIPFKF